MVARVKRALLVALLSSAAFVDDAAAQVTATCQLNEVENRVYDLVPLEGTLQSTEQQLTAELPFMQYLPKGYDPAKKWPVVVFLHGIGEVGGTLRKVTEHSLPRVVESPEWNWPFIVLSPVLPTSSWHPRWELVRDILDHAVNTLGGDPNRLYLTGVSHGGAGTMAISIELADKLAAIMPVTPGGDADDYNWDRRAAIAQTPTMFIIGTADSEYQNTLNWAGDLEGSGAPLFAEYTLPAAEEHLDTIPVSVLDESHVFVSYQDLPHDIWHAAYGNFCDVLTTYKTVQYDWLLRQSRDGSAFVDPREPGPAPVPDAGASGGGGGSAGSPGGSAGTTSGGASGSAGTTAMLPDAGAGTSSANPPPGAAATEGGCALRQVTDAAPLWSSLSLLAISALLLRRRYAARR
jgi:dienelactone hydrolase